ncbi:MAG TPA: hypothetical protein PLB02_00920 [Thermoanaerobaculia bacterium]|nr:hypothetical protein [Thermoanaerobaculia bacterium]
MDQAQFHLGSLRVQPVLDLRDLGWNNNVFGTPTNPVGDFVVTVDAGAKLIVPLGSKLYVRGIVAPEYTWYDKTTELRHFGGTYGGGLVGLFNRLRFDASGGYRSWVTIVNSESQTTAPENLSWGRARLEVDVLRRLALFGGYDVAETSYDTSGLPPETAYQVAVLDRTETAWRGGLRYKFSDQVSLGAQVEGTRANFVYEAWDRNNKSTGYLLVARYDRPRFYLVASGGYRKGAGQNPGSFYPPYRTGTYFFFASYFLLKNLELQCYGHRRPVDSYYLENPYYFETRTSLGARWGLGQRVTLLAYGTVGPNSYPREVYVGLVPVARDDQTTEYGGGLEFRFYRNAALKVVASEWSSSSNVPGYSYSIFRFSTGISITGDFNR